MVLLMYSDTHHNLAKAFIGERGAFVPADPRFYKKNDVTKTKYTWCTYLIHSLLMKMSL